MRELKSGPGVKHDLAKTFAVIRPDLTASLVPVTPGVYELLDQDFDHFRGHVLLSCYTFKEDWPSWERHPAGDELVCLLSGEATMLFEEGGTERGVRLEKPGEYVLVPKGTWHTARTSVSTTMLFLTPGEGTENRPIA
jgi:mannose-6-phosphate isomerase-like protein (cupin superfamily)